MLTIRGSLLAFVLSACGSAEPATPPQFSGPPFDNVSSASSSVHVSLRFSPGPLPSRGVNAVELVVTGMSGEQRDDVELSVLPWMPAMNHGASAEPIIVAQGSGRFLAENVNLFMPGRWQLRFGLVDTKTHESDKRTIEFEVR